MKVGFTAGNFDLLHPGYIKCFKDAKRHCEKFIVFLQKDPSLHRKSKYKPVIPLYDRYEALMAIQYIDDEYVYQTDTITIYDDILDTLFIEVPVVEYDTIIEIQYEEIVEYIDCDSGLPCNSSIMEVIDKSIGNSVIYNIKGQAILTREGLYIENGKIYYKK